jgi:UDP-3-O-[3-hydroxymyristoyl] glucosamine N-acyltransferase
MNFHGVGSLVDPFRSHVNKSLHSKISRRTYVAVTLPEPETLWPLPIKKELLSTALHSHFLCQLVKQDRSNITARINVAIYKGIKRHLSDNSLIRQYCFIRQYCLIRQYCVMRQYCVIRHYCYQTIHCYQTILCYQKLLLSNNSLSDNTVIR